MKIRTLVMSLLAVAALLCGAAAAVAVTGQLARSAPSPSAAKRQYCPPQSGHGQGSGPGQGKGCGQDGR
jgi:Spy/CpxP family protein refolding chaperone